MKKTGEIVDMKNAKTSRPEPQIKGALPVTQTPPKTLDSRSKVEQPPVETTTHGEAVTVRQHVRSKPLRKDEPEVRLRMMTREEREQWQRVRRAEEE